MESFINRQLLQLHELGVMRYIIRKIVFCSSYFIMCLLFPVYLLILIIRPFKLVRFGSLISDTLGHFVMNTELYCCERDHGIQPENSFDIFYCNSLTANYQILKMWKRVLRVNQLAFYLSRLNNIIPGGDIHKITVIRSDRDINGLMERSRVHLHFNSEEEYEAKAGLKEMGILDCNRFICFVIRDPLYKESLWPNRDWSYHNYRNCNIQNYISAAEELARRNYYVIRMGSIVKDVMHTDNPMIIEYAHEGFRTELLDVYLGANCHFFISCGTGIDAVPGVFRRPILYVNVVPVEALNTWNSSSITIFKKHWIKAERRYMTLREIIEFGAGRFARTEQYEKHGIEVIENTPEEIRDVTIEMDERLQGRWETTEEDEDLQRHFWRLFPKSELHGEIVSRIGTEFLRQNRELLG